MAILEKEVATKLCARNISYYENLGYEIKRYANKKGELLVKRGTVIEVKIEHLAESSNVRVTKICDKCGIQVKNQPYVGVLRCRKNGVDLCQKCGKELGREINPRKIEYNNSLEHFAINNKMFYLIEEYSNKNKKLMSEITAYSHKSYWWNCSKCKSEFKMRGAERSKGSNCSYCVGKKVNQTNSLASLNPSLAKEWNYEKNGDLTPDSVTCRSNKSAWWKCEKNHTWKTTISHRNDGTACPYCASQLPTPDYNLLAINPMLCEEWDYEKNKKLPSEYLPNGKSKVHWKCDCGHRWSATIFNRNRGRGCPACAESKGEKRIRQWLNDNHIKFESQKKFEHLVGIGGGDLSYDFYLPERNILIEYQGQFHDGNNGKGNYYMTATLPTRKKHDEIKRNYAEKNYIELLEIWYFNFDNIDKILSEKLILK